MEQGEPKISFFFHLAIQEKVNHLVKPEKAIADFRTDVTGVSQSDLVGVTCSLVDIQVLCNHFYNFL